ncbi:MAG: energy coupling factor transporter S component ThiW [Promethearchaeota archaeon]|jgi:energy coupling factor transporter S component ThiW
MSLNKSNQNTSESKERTIIQRSMTKSIATTAIFVGVGLVLSYLNYFAYFEIMGAKIFPFAHFINGILGVLVGFSFAVIAALSIASLRYPLGIGSIHAFHGGISGAIVVGIIAFILWKKKPKYVELAALTEPVGTVFIGATIAYFITPIYPLVIWWVLFAASSIPGSILGYIMLRILKRANISRMDYFEE